MSEISEEDWKIVEARLQYDLDHNIGMDMRLMILNKEEEKNG